MYICNEKLVRAPRSEPCFGPFSHYFTTKKMIAMMQWSTTLLSAAPMPTRRSGQINGREEREIRAQHVYGICNILTETATYDSGEVAGAHYNKFLPT